MKLSDFDYTLPKELIAQYPAEKRDESMLLVLHKDTGEIEHRIFRDIIEYLNPEDLLVLNNTRVLPARLMGRKETGGRVEALVLDATGLTSEVAVWRLPKSDTGNERVEYEVLLKPTRGCKVGSKIIFGNGELNAEIIRIENGRRFLKFDCNGDLKIALDRLGEMPLPSYIKRETTSSDKERYQTVYASRSGAVAAPTAGLHFTKELLEYVSKKGVDVEYVTLHVGYGTFKPVKSEDITGHKMEKEYFEIDNNVIEKLNKKNGRVIAVGTTSCRVLETVAAKFTLPEAEQALQLQQGWTNLFIYPGYKFKIVDGLLTNFHLPKTTLLMLVAAFCGRGRLFKAYEEAIKERYRFYSYGDAMLIL